jgi:hypothetical protein
LLSFFSREKIEVLSINTNPGIRISTDVPIILAYFTAVRMMYDLDGYPHSVVSTESCSCSHCPTVDRDVRRVVVIPQLF